MMIKMHGIAQVMDSRLTVTWDSPSTYTHFSLRIGWIILTIMWSTMRTLSDGCGDETALYHLRRPSQWETF